MEKIPITEARIALCGPSGTGKSTLARFIADTLHIPYRENSAGLLLSPEQQDYLVNKYGWTKSGHKDVIKLSNSNPGFAWEFQVELLKTRSQFIQDNQSFIIDRSPVDNITYFLLQTSHLVSEDQCELFLATAHAAMKPITHLIFLPTLTNWVENNGSRIANPVYQQMVSSVFRYAIDRYINPDGSLPYYFKECTTWGLERRQGDILDWLTYTIDTH